MNGTKLPEPPMPGDLTPPAPRQLRDLWAKMTSIYGHRWVSAFGDSPEYGNDAKTPGAFTDAGKVWSQGLIGITGQQMALGLRRALMSAEPFPPNLPEFRAMCLGIPTLATVQLVLAKPHDQPEDVQAFCRLVWRFIDTYRFARAGVGQASSTVKDAYQIAREYRMALGPLPPPPVALLPEVAEERPLTKAEIEARDAARDAAAREHIARCQEMLRISEPEPTEESEGDT
jgi:hypothetical protein